MYLLLDIVEPNVSLFIDLSVLSNTNQFMTMWIIFYETKCSEKKRKLFFKKHAKFIRDIASTVLSNQN